MGSTEGERTVQRLLRAYERFDVDAMLECFTEDGEYHAMSMESAVGKVELRKLWSEWTEVMTSVSCDVHRQLTDGTIVMHERTDRVTVGGRNIVTPVASMFDIDSGLIADWREYFDKPRTP